MFNIFELLKTKCDWYFIVSFLLFIYFISSWHLNNNAFPTGDGVMYLFDTYRSYQNFFDNGFIAGLFELYNTRSFRPGIFQVFGVPFLIIFGNDPLYATAGVSIFFCSLLFIYIYKFVNLYIKPHFSALITLFLLVHPMFYFYFFSNMSEIAYMAILTAGIYYMIKSDFFFNKKDLIISSLFIGLSLCIRPAESVFLAIVFLPFIIASYKKGNIFKHEFLKSFNIILTLLLLFFYLVYILENPYLSILSTIITIIVWYKILKKIIRRDDSNLLIFVSISCLIIFIYWIPGIPELMYWGYHASVGEVVTSLLKESAPFGMMLKQFFETYATFFSLVALFSIIPIIYLIKNKKFNLNNSKFHIFSMAFIYISLILISYIFSENDGQFLRRTLIAIILIFVSLFSLIFIDNDKYLKFNRNMLSVTMIAIIFINYTSLLNRHITNKNDIFDKSINEVAIESQKYLNLIPGLHGYYARPDMILVPDPRENRHIKLINTIKERRCIIDKINCLKGKNILTTTPIIHNNNDFIAPFTTGFVNEVLQKNNFGIGPIHVNKGENFYEILNQRNINFVMIELSENITQDDLDKSIDVAYNFTADVIKRYLAGNKDKLVYVDSFYIYSQKMIILKNIGNE